VARILLIDDSDVDARVVQDYLESAGHEVRREANGSAGLRAMWEGRPDVVLLDVVMPEMDGWTTCSRIREVSDTPIIMLTSLNREEDIVRGLELGADDFLSKPLSLRQLGARILAVLRRSQRDSAAAEQGGVVYDDGDLTIDVQSHEVRLDGTLLDLSPTEFKLLTALARAPGRLHTYAELLSQVWGPEYVDDIEFLRVYISRLRQKIETDPSNAVRILTERGFGYRLARP
jgi:two-component system KDP operon response regulator KdpE